MDAKREKAVHFTDKMVLIGIGLGLIYWMIETIYSLFMLTDIGFIGRLFGPGLSGVTTRVVVLCLFTIFGSHTQITLNKLRTAEAELKDAKSETEALRRENERLKPKEIDNE